MGKVKEVEITISQLINDLEEGITWLRSEDAGNGSIQAKYGATDREIGVIKQHPKLIGLEPRLVLFKIIDDTESRNEGNGQVDSGSDRLDKNVGNGEDISTSKKSISKGTDSMGSRDKSMGGVDTQDALLEVGRSETGAEEFSTESTRETDTETLINI